MPEPPPFEGETAPTIAQETPSPARLHQPTPLVLTKVQVPRQRSALVHRPRLLQRLDEGMQGPLTLLSAPAGSGKTTLLTSWLAASGTRGAWFSVEAQDNDPVRFFSYMLAALQRLEPELGSSLLPLLRSGGPGSLETFLALLINEVQSWQGDRLVLVLDDYHLIATQSIHQALAYLVEHLPPQLHLIIATRADPSLPLPRLRSRGHLTELRALDLRFVPEETEQFLDEVMHLHLSMQENRFLQMRTEGWIVGLQFAALALQGKTETAAFLSSFTGSHRFILEYLSEEVLAHQTPTIHFFLLSTSVLERLCDSLCNVVTGQQDSQAILETLERANLFVVSLDDEQHWYRYHHLFAEVLRHRLKRSSPHLISTLHQRASHWYEQQGLLVEAVQHALDAHDLEYAAVLAEQWALNMVTQGHVHTLLQWLNSFPAAVMDQHPLLHVYHAFVFYVTDRLEEAEGRLQDAERALGEETRTERSGIIRGLAAIIRGISARYSGDISRYVDLGKQALDLLPETVPIIRALAALMEGHVCLENGDVTLATEQQLKACVVAGRSLHYLLMQFRGLSILAYLHVLQGRLREAAAVYEEAEQVRQGQETVLQMAASDPSGFYYGIWGDLWREWNQLDRAEDLVSQGMELINQTRQVYADDVLFCHLAQARVYQARGKYSKACGVLDAFIQLADTHHFVPPLKAIATSVRIQIELMQGNLAPAVHWAKNCGLSINDELHYLREREYLTLVRVHIAEARVQSRASFLADALILLERLLVNAQAMDRVQSILEILVLKALAQHAGGTLPAALNTLSDAFTLAEPAGYVRLFLDEGTPLLTLLPQVSKANPQLHGYVQQLLTHAHGTTLASPEPETEQEQSLVEPLSKRELEVLRQMAIGASNEEIADHLVIAVGTVKRHVSNILAKLAVSNRTQAVARARELGSL